MQEEDHFNQDDNDFNNQVEMIRRNMSGDPITTLKVGSKIAFSDVSKVSSHALSIGKIPEDNMNVKPSQGYAL